MLKRLRLPRLPADDSAQAPPPGSPDLHAHATAPG